MDLLDRYLMTISHNLPAARAEDITAELRDDLLDQVEAREAKLGRPLDKTEMSALIKDFGHPLVVAGRYRDHQYLIGPEVFPFYFHALRIVLVITIAVFFFSAMAPMIMGAEHSSHAVSQGVGKAWNTLFTAFACVTILFALFERHGFPAAHLKLWKPEQLPEPQGKKGPWGQAIELGFGIAFLAWWAGALPLPTGFRQIGISIGVTPVWEALYWPILILLAARLVYTLISWLMPQAVMARVLLGVGTIIGGLWAVHALRTAGSLFDVRSTGASPAKVVEYQATIDAATQVTLAIMAIVWAIALIMLIYQLVVRPRQARG